MCYDEAGTRSVASFSGRPGAGAGNQGYVGVRRAADRTTGRVICAVLAVAALGTLALPVSPLPRLAIIAPITYFVAVLADAATAVVLLGTWSSSPARRSSFVLALSFCVSSVVMLAAIVVLPLLPAEPPVFSAPAQSGIWLFVIWHVNVAAGALIYVAVRRTDSIGRPSRRFVRVAVSVAALVTAGTLTVCLAGGASLPVLANGSGVPGLLTTGAGPFAAALLALASLLVFRLRDPLPVERALAFSLLALALGMALFFADGHRYSAAFYAGRGLLLLGSALVLIAAVRTLVVSRERLGAIEGALSRAVGEAAQQAGRIRAVWEIASQPEQSDADRYNAILQIATAALRPGAPMFGTLSHVDDDELVFDATSWSGPQDARLRIGDGVYPGARVPFDSTMQSLLGINGRSTMAWSDLDFLDGRGMMFEAHDVRSFVGAPLMIGRQTYFVSFLSTQSSEREAFAEDDIAFVDVVAAFMANRFNQQKQFERIQFQVEHDALTGLENRVQFRKAVRDEIQAGTPFAVAFVDLDGFRHVNEREGNQIGDEVLVEVASSLASVSNNDLVARMSADEFGVLVRGISDGDTGAALVEYAELFHNPFHTGDRNGTQMLGLGASIGAAYYPRDGASAEALMRRADVALDVAKAAGGSATVVFDPPMEAILKESHLRVVELADAIAHDQLALTYQPTFELANRRITGAEALVRWDHPERGRLMPAEFITFAEHNGLIAALSRWVFRRAARDISSIAALPERFRIYINLAAQMLDDIPFITELRTALDADPRLVEHLGIEVTETAAMQNVERSMNTIDLFRGWGLSVAIDDFGTGYSSLSYLKELSVDVIKIDRSFVMGLPGNVRDGAITEMLLRITDQFGFATLAEGIETEDQAAWLLEHGCRYGQGYLIAKPLSFDDLLARLEASYAV
jgi:diguanylate cyclase (GGDEF)-like protein